MGYGKWLGGALGFMTMGPLGALAGYFVGSWFDAVSESNESSNEDRSQYSAEGQRNSFFFSMMVLTSYIIRSDGRIMHSEMEFVRRYLRNNFGPGAAEQGERVLLMLFEKAKELDRRSPDAFRKMIYDCGTQIADNMPEAQRLQLLAFLIQIAKSDGYVSPEEVEALNEVAAAMRLSMQDFDSMYNLGGKSLAEAYKVLEIDASATDDEVKAAYRKLALKHHPDRVATLGEDVRRAAEEKFQQINNAKDQIYKARGIK